MFTASVYKVRTFILVLIFFWMKLCNSFFTFWKLHKCQHSLNVNWTYFNIYNSNDSSTFKSRPFKFLSHRRTSKRWYDKFWPFTILSSKHKANDQLKFPCWHNGRNLNGLGLSLRNRKLWKKTRRGHVAHIPVIRLTSCKTESFTIPWDLL